MAQVRTSSENEVLDAIVERAQEMTDFVFCRLIELHPNAPKSNIWELADLITDTLLFSEETRRPN